MRLRSQIDTSCAETLATRLLRRPEKLPGYCLRPRRTSCGADEAWRLNQHRPNGIDEPGLIVAQSGVAGDAGENETKRTATPSSIL